MAGSKPLSFSEAHAPGLCSVAYLPVLGGGGAGPTLVTAGPDARLCYRAADAPVGPPQKEVAVENNGAAAPVHCVAAAAGRPVVTGDDQHFVRVRVCLVPRGAVGCQPSQGWLAAWPAWRGVHVCVWLTATRRPAVLRLL